MKEYSKKMDIPLYVLKNENGKLRKYLVGITSNNKYTENLTNELSVRQKEILMKNGNNPLSKDYKDFNKEARKILRISKGEEEYISNPVNSIDILENKREITDKEKERIIKEILDKKIITGKIKVE